MVKVIAAGTISPLRRGLDRYYQAFENGDLDAGRFQTRLADPEVALESPSDEDALLANSSMPPPKPTSTAAASPRSRPAPRHPRGRRA